MVESTTLLKLLNFGWAELGGSQLQQLFDIFPNPEHIGRPVWTAPVQVEGAVFNLHAPLSVNKTFTHPNTSKTPNILNIIKINRRKTNYVGIA